MTEQEMRQQIEKEIRQAKTEYARQWRDKNKDKVKLYQTRYKKKNKAKLNAYQRAWAKAHPEKRAEYSKNYWLRVVERKKNLEQ